jgi:histidinol-phosphatase
MTHNLEQDLDLALRLADVADDISSRYFRQSMQIDFKQDKTPVSEVDLKIERCLRDIIVAERPNDEIVGEELGQYEHLSRLNKRMWVIDPLDHTRHYTRGNPEYGTLIALSVNSQPCVGVISAPSLGQRWYASKGGGAWTNKQKIKVSSVTSLNATHLGIAGHREWLEQYNWDKILMLLNHVEYSYGTSGGFMPAMMVASGYLDAFVEPWGAIWDHSATAIIIQEAGGQASTLLGSPVAGGSLLVSNRLLHNELLNYFKQK